MDDLKVVKTTSSFEKQDKVQISNQIAKMIRKRPDIMKLAKQNSVTLGGTMTLKSLKTFVSEHESKDFNKNVKGSFNFKNLRTGTKPLLKSSLPSISEHSGPKGV